MKADTCCFTGHRRFYKPMQELKRPLWNAINWLYTSEGVRNFCCGGALGFDTLAARAVLALRDRFPDVRLVLILPCRDQAKSWGLEDVRVYEEIKSLADEVIYTGEHYTRFCMHVRNRRLVDESGYCISYLVQDKGGTAFTVDYAKKKGVPVINIK